MTRSAGGIDSADAARSEPSPVGDATTSVRLFHGGVAGLRPGDVIRPGMASARFVDGCPDCEAHKAGEHGPLSGDPATPEDWVYASEDRPYARYYASRAGLGWLYGVTLRCDVERSVEDPPEFGCWRAREAVVTSVLERAVRLTMKERRRLFVRWGGTEREFDEMIRTVLSRGAVSADDRTPAPVSNGPGSASGGER